MAEEKNSFLVYTDLIDTVEKLTNEQAGLLFKTMLRYTNDLNPVVNDFVVDLVFTPIKLQLKRDLKNWDKSKTKKSEGGQIGNLKRWNPELYERFVKKELTLEQCNEIIQNRIVSDTDKSDKKGIEQQQTAFNFGNNQISGVAENRIPTENIASVAVNVNDTVNVTVPVTVIEKEEKGDTDFFSLSSFFPEEVEKIENSKKNKVVEDLKFFFGVETMPYYRQQVNISHFVNLLESQSLLDHFEEQFNSYREFKILTGNKHSLDGFIGTESEGFKNGKWNNSNWTKSLEDHLSAGKKPAKIGIVEAVTAANQIVNPYNNPENE